MGLESFIKMDEGLRLVATAAMITMLFALPWVSSLLLSRSRRSRASAQKKIWVAQEVILAVSVATAFAATAATVQVSAALIAPWIWDAGPQVSSLDSPVTARSLFFWLTVVALGWSVFRWAGLNSVRDVHRCAKESMDLVSRHRSRRPAREGAEEE